MATPTIVRNNRAFVQVKMPFVLGAVDTHKVYAASGPHEEFRLKRSFVPAENPDDVGFAYDYWNHAEFGFASDGSQAYAVKITDVKAGVETARAAAPELQVLVVSEDVAIPLFLSRAPNVAFVNGDFVVAIKGFARWRMEIQVALNGGTSVTFQIDTANVRTGPYRTAPAYLLAAGTTTLVPNDFKIVQDSLFTIEADIQEPRFIRVRAKAGGALETFAANLERLARIK